MPSSISPGGRAGDEQSRGEGRVGRELNVPPRRQLFGRHDAEAGDSVLPSVFRLARGGGVWRVREAQVEAKTSGREPATLCRALS